jgi:hypothetical protein
METVELFVHSPSSRGFDQTQETVIDLPALTMVEYKDGQIHAVTPHDEKGSVTTVLDRLAEFEDETVSVGQDS